MPSDAALSRLNVSANSARWNATRVTTTITVATTSRRTSSAVTPRIDPNSSVVRSRADAAEMITTPRASMPTNSSPMAVSSPTRLRRFTSVIPPAITSALTSAPPMTLNPQIWARATPGMTPWARASPMNASPRSTTHVPTSEHTTTARSAPSSAVRMKLGSNASVSQDMGVWARRLGGACHPIVVRRTRTCQTSLN